MATTEQSQLKVLTPRLADSLRSFNEAARTLQRMGVQIAGFYPTEHRMEITSDGGRQLMSARLVIGYQRHATAASARYSVQFQGVTLEWRESITCHDYQH